MNLFKDNFAVFCVCMDGIRVAFQGHLVNTEELIFSVCHVIELLVVFNWFLTNKYIADI